MPVEHSAGAIVFRREKRRLLYLLLHYEEGHWGSAKGHIEKGETIEETARREIREESGLTDLRFCPGFKETNKYFFAAGGQRIFKTVVFLLAETRTEKVTLSFEHTD
jgi:bis(5'-nucleosidyl)-tetraphosphatase